MDAERLRPHHSRNQSQVLENGSEYQSSDDGYDYNVVDDAPEAQPTKPKELNPVKPQTPSEASSALERPDLTDNAFAETLPHIYQRHAGGRRAKIPTDEVDLEKGLNGIGTTGEGEPPKAIPKLTNIKLRWTMPEVDNKHTLHLNYDDVDLGAQEPHLQRRRVRWQ